MYKYNIYNLDQWMFRNTLCIDWWIDTHNFHCGTVYPVHLEGRTDTEPFQMNNLVSELHQIIVLLTLTVPF